MTIAPPSMIRLTKITDYGIVLLSHLVRPAGSTEENDAQWVTAAALAARARLPSPVVGKVLKQLARAELLDSQRGAQGGYRLARPAAEISIADIIAALEGPIALTECAEHSLEDCSYESYCRVRTNWRRINEAVVAALDGISLAEMISQEQTQDRKMAERLVPLSVMHSIRGVITPGRAH